MGIKNKIVFGNVMHKRLCPKVNEFSYGIYYIALSLNNLADIPIKHNSYGLLSFYDKDHGSKGGRSLKEWAYNILEEYNIKDVDDILLVCMPRVLGYVFNPVSFWFCLDKHRQVRAVICEVNNTFGETHSYICSDEDGENITKDMWLHAKKVFHVSPFLKREGYYKFRFNLSEDKLAVYINYYGEDDTKTLLTALTGKLIEMDQKSLSAAFWKYPLITFKAIYLIHWQAFKLISKGIKHIKKPEQLDIRVSNSVKR